MKSVLLGLVLLTGWQVGVVLEKQKERGITERTRASMGIWGEGEKRVKGPVNTGPREKATVFYVKVGGQVVNPGEVLWEPGMTVADAIELAEGATTFGALNRTRVYRRGEVSTVDASVMEVGEIKLIRQEMSSFWESYEFWNLQPGDVVEVPEKLWIGK